MRRAALILASYAVTGAVLAGCALVVCALVASGAARVLIERASLPILRSTTGQRPGLDGGAGIHQQHNRRETP